MYGQALAAPKRWGSFRRAVGVYLTLVLAVGAVTTPTTLFATDYYVSTAGSNGNTGLASTPGSAFRTITHAISIAGSGDTINVGAGTFDAAGGETFPLDIESGLAIMGAGSSSTTVSAPAGGPVFFGDTDLSSSTVLSGMTITHDGQSDDNIGISLELDDVTMSPMIRNNVFAGLGDPNDPFDTGGLGIYGWVSDSSGSDEIFTPTIDGNTFTGWGTGILLTGTANAGGSGDEVSPTISNNSFTLVGDGMYFSFTGGTMEGKVSPLIENNTFTDGTEDAVDFNLTSFNVNDSLVFSPTVRNNTIDDFGDQAVEISFSTITGSGTVTSDIEITGNRSSDTDDTFFDLDMDEIYVPFDTKITVRGNSVTGTGDSAVSFDVSSLSTITNLDYTVENNMISDVAGDAISFSLTETMKFTSSATGSIVVRGNTIDGATDDGIDFSITTFTLNGAEMTILVEGNSVTNVDDDGIDFELTQWKLTDPNDITLTIKDNHVAGSGNDGLYYSVYNNDEMPGTMVTCNTFTGNVAYGAEITSSVGILDLPDFGGGATGSPGYNTIAGNTGGFELYNNVPAAEASTVFGKSNWWGTTTGIDSLIRDNDELGSIGVVDFSSFLMVAPTSGVTFTLDDELVGNRINYTAVVTGSGDCGSAGATFTIDVPTGTTLVPGSVATTSGDIIPDPNDPNTPITVQIGHIAPMEVVTITFSVDVDPGVSKVSAQGKVTRNGGSTTFSAGSAAGGPTDTYLPTDVPTLEWWAMMLMTTILGGAALLILRKRRHGIAVLLALALALPAASLFAETREKTVKKPASSEVATTLVKAEARVAAKGAKIVTLRLADGARYDVKRGDIEVKDRRTKGSRARASRELKADALWNGILPASQPMLVRVKYESDGSVKKVRVEIYSTLDEARKIVAEHEARKAEHRAKRAAKSQ